MQFLVVESDEHVAFFDAIAKVDGQLLDFAIDLGFDGYLFGRPNFAGGFDIEADVFAFGGRGAETPGAFGRGFGSLKIGQFLVSKETANSQKEQNHNPFIHA